jgi:regulatory protein
LTTKSDKPALNLRQKALDYLARREYSAAELHSKLSAIAMQHAIASEEVDAIIKDFQQKNWLSDVRFTEQIVHARKAKFGSMKIAHELKQKGVSAELIAVAMQHVQDNEFENAKLVWQKKFKDKPESREAWAKQARFLQSRGFSLNIIRRVIASQDED